MKSVKSIKSSANLKKGAIYLALSFILLILPFVKFMESFYFSHNARKESARIVDYNPEIMGKAGGRREIKDYYKITYGGIEKKIQLGSRMVTSKEKVQRPEEGAPYKAGDSLSVLYLSENPRIMILEKRGNMLLAFYHSFSNVALLYLFKVASLIFFFLSIKHTLKTLLK